MEKYNILMFESAIRDLEDIVDYINNLSPNTALQQYDNIIKKIESLSEMPKKCQLLKDHNLKV